MGRAWSRYDEDGRNAGYIAAYAVPVASATVQRPVINASNRFETIQIPRWSRAQPTIRSLPDQ